MVRRRFKVGLNEAWMTLAISTLFNFGPCSSFAGVALLDQNSWKITLSGFVEADQILDSVRSFSEALGSNPVDRPEVSLGQLSRYEFSVRNSRLAFTIEAPSVNEWKSKGYFEMDFLGYDPAPGASNNEGLFYTSPTLRMRHGFFQTEKDGWTIMVGQYWKILGWQPYYFLATVNVYPVPAALSTWTPQARLIKAIDLGGDSNLLQVQAGITRPVQRDSGLPAIEGGVRFSSGARTSGFSGGAAGDQRTQAMSVALSGTLREITVPTLGGLPGDVTNFPASAVAANVLIPVIASADGKDPANTLTLVGEASVGSGYGDQFAGYSGNLPSPLSVAGSSTTTGLMTANRGFNLDAGIGDFDSNGTFRLVQLRQFNFQLQYHLPSDLRTWIGAGYGQIYSPNIDLIANPTTFKTSAGKVAYDREEFAFLNVFHDFTDHIRVGAEYSYLGTHYGDGALNHDDRYQVSAYYRF